MLVWDHFLNQFWMILGFNFSPFLGTFLEKKSGNEGNGEHVIFDTPLQRKPHFRGSEGTKIKEIS